MKDEIVLITGSTDGIGKQTAIDLAEKGASVIVHGRNRNKAAEAADEVARKSGNKNIDSVSADLASFNDIHNMADELHAKYHHLDVLINNAGVFMNQRKLSEEGIEMTLAVNHLAFFLLTGLVLDLVKNSEYARIINVASMAHASHIDFDNLQGEKHFEGYDAYSRSKLCNILFTYKLARMVRDTPVTVNCLHPGVIRTKLLKAGWGMGGSGTEKGAETIVYLASSAEVQDVSGKYFANRKMIGSAGVSYDIAVQNKLWTATEQLCRFEYSI